MNPAQPRFLHPVEITRPQEVPLPKGPTVVPRRRSEPFRWVKEFLKQLRRAWREDCLRQAEIEKQLRERELTRGQVYSITERRNLF